MPKFELIGKGDQVFQRLDAFTQAYIEAAIFTEAESLGDESTLAFQQIHHETLARMVIDCAQFQRRTSDLLIDENRTKPSTETCALGHAGHDFLLTRNGHGAGFWDGDWLEPAATTLTAAAKRFSEMSLYRGRDGAIHHEP